ncbi:HAD family hydrolase [Bulleidia sp. zg-1006]|uniref:HAD family hydrolase n=1 Tax=Bulleidia sp. zg-1006 TaxID=2806552 RepID=UPI00193A2575|nr:HAD family hydrolase [Bulleidia sp. zg-1006]QRG86543.1 haloacid dehalogenase-like hydrolase [Bulleidia sp. zg-1006]
MKKAALIYDFDETLSRKNMFEFDVLADLGYKDSSVFWQEMIQLALEKDMDYVAAYLLLLKEGFAKKGMPLTRKKLQQYAKNIVLCDGVETWFSRISDFGKTLDLEVEHYIISSGLKEILEALDIAKYITKIYASSYFYDEKKEAYWPGQVINYTTKTQYVFRINKQILSDTVANVNSYVPLEERPIPISRMMYIGDGFTDVPCMRLVKEYKGKSIVVYHPSQKESLKVSETLLKEGRANVAVPANYEENSPLDKYVKQNLKEIREKINLKEKENKIWIE